MSTSEEAASVSNSDDYTDMSSDENSNGSDGDSLTITQQPGKKVTKSMQVILKEMVRKRLLLDEKEMILNFLAEDVDNEYGNNMDVDLHDSPTDNLKTFASFLHYYAPRAYEYIIENYITPLPSIKELGIWCENDKFRPGFTKQAFDILEKRSIEKGKRLICSLVADDLQLFVRSSYVDIDVGAGPLDCDAEEIEGRHAYVILLVSLEDNWKIPVCYFISDETSNETQANLIRMCLHRTHETGVDVVSITTTTGLAKALGCELDNYKKLKTTFGHPASGKPVAVFADPSLCIRSLYHTFSSKKEMFNGQRGTIRMGLIKEVHNILTNKTFQFNSSTDMLDLRNILAKFDLISELIMPSVGAALEICKNRLKLQKFDGAGPTIEYITMINTLYYILYAKVGEAGYRLPISQENGKEILEFLEEAKKYISSISYAKPMIGRYTNRQLAVEDPNFIVAGFKDLLISIETLKHLYTTLVETGVVNCIPTYCLSWDQMDEFFGVIRKLNPREGGAEFQPIYKRFFTDLKFTLTGCHPIESYSITNLNKALDAIKKTSGKRAFDELYSVVKEKRRKTEDEKRAFTNVTKLVKHLEKEHDKMEKQHMVGYIAGYAVVQLAEALRCEECIDGLLTNEKMWFHRYITSKELKGICLPSEAMFRICWECERSLQVRRKVTAADKRRMLSRALRAPPATHHVHHVHLTKAVIAKYLRLRLGLDKQPNRRSMQQKGFFNMFSMLW